MRRRVGSILGLCFLSSFLTTASLHGQDLDTTPAGVTQEFRFRALKVGAAVIRFRHTMGGSTVESTVRVR